MVRRVRLDAELVRRGLARSRQQAGELVSAGLVQLDGRPATKPATAVASDVSLRVSAAPDGEVPYASRGGTKLAGVLDAFAAAVDGLRVSGRRCLDAGASTGGFTDVLLRRGATEVVAVDVGYGQLAWPLRQDPRVRVLDRTNARELDPDRIGGPVELVVADLSFIGLGLVLPALVRCCAPDADLVPMVKPQFEVGREALGPGGVVRDPELRAAAVLGVVARAAELGLRLRAVRASPLPGPAGNVEYFVWLHHSGVGAGAPYDASAAVEAVEAAVRAGPR